MRGLWWSAQQLGHWEVSRFEMASRTFEQWRGDTGDMILSKSCSEHTSLRTNRLSASRVLAAAGQLAKAEIAFLRKAEDVKISFVRPRPELQP